MQYTALDHVREIMLIGRPRQTSYFVAMEAMFASRAAFRFEPCDNFRGREGS